MKVLQLTVHFPPNVGGVETHLSDLVAALIKRKWEVLVLCYRPLSTVVPWKIYEVERKVKIFRIPWIAGFFYKFIRHPHIEFLYLFLGLFFATPLVLIFNKPDLIHAHGLVAASVAVFWGKIFGIDTVVSTHSIYSFPKSGWYHDFAKLIFNLARKVLCLSYQSLEEIRDLGIDKDKISTFTYWIDLKKFQKVQNAKNKLGWEDKFTVLFVGRLILEKGIDVLLRSVKDWNKRINLVFVGVGPLQKDILDTVKKNSRVKFAGKINQDSLPVFYSAADLVIVPSTSQEGFGRVIIEALACSTPVLASRKGAISEVMDSRVGKLIDINPDNIKKEVEYFFNHPRKLKNLAKNGRQFVEKRYGESNVQRIIEAYTS